MSRELLRFPILMELGLEPWSWPELPFVWRHRPHLADGFARLCRIEDLRGARADGEVLGLNPAAQTVSFRSSIDEPAKSLPMTRIRRLTLTEPLRPTLREDGAPLDRLPIATQERDYCLYPPGGAAALRGRTLGHVETPDGLYLFEPVDDMTALHRSFVPHAAYTRCEFGPSAAQIAADQWVVTPDQLINAIAQQQRKKILPIGQSLLQLGLLTEHQLAHALGRQNDEVPLGKMLVAEGLISQHDLQTAIAHKLGYPFVDLNRFPINEDVLRKLSPSMALKARALPLMFDKKRLVVAVDDPARATKLRPVQAFSNLRIVPVLASRVQILSALGNLVKQDVWSNNVEEYIDFFQTTH